jgi:hypothetical protein
MKSLTLQPAMPVTERRVRDRRRATIRSLIVGGFFKCRRRGPRRRADCHQGYYVDWYDAKLLTTALTIFLLCCLDALFTLSLLESGADEINLLMAALIEIGTGTFVNIKLGATAIGITILVVHASFRLVGSFRVRHAIYSIFGTYGLLFVYQLALLTRGL